MTTPTQANYSYAQLEGIWLQAAQGTKYATQQWAALMAAIAEAESRGNPIAQNQTDNGGTQTSYGLWQISTGTHAAPSPNWNNPIVNAQLAIGKLDSQGLGAWGTYDSGAYKAYLSSSTTPDTTGVPAIAGTSAADAGQAAGQANCAWSVNWSFGLTGNLCLLSNSQVRAFAGIGIAVVGGLVLGWGVSILAASTGLKLAGVLMGAVPGASKAAGAAGASATASELALAA